jgi:hypothetical protein
LAGSQGSPAQGLIVQKCTAAYRNKTGGTDGAAKGSSSTTDSAVEACCLIIGKCAVDDR